MTIKDHFLSLVEKCTKAEAKGSDILSTPLLSDAFVQFVSTSLGQPVERIQLTAWRSSRLVDTSHTSDLTWIEFGNELEVAATTVCAKDDQEAFVQGVCAPGGRRNDLMQRMTMLALDCDGTGTWDALRGVLETLGLAHILYQSSGYKPELPKWRCIVPLATPFDVTTEEKRHAWRHAYNVARVLWGHAAQLADEGFDQTLSTPCQPVYVGNRRTEDTPDRVVIVAQGRAFDMHAFASAIPAAPPFTPAGIATADRPTMTFLFEAAGTLGGKLGNKYLVRCPWDTEHSDPLGEDAEYTSATVVLPPTEGNTLGLFKCLHGSCQGRWSREHVASKLGPEITAEAERLETAARLGAFPGDMSIQDPPVEGAAPVVEPDADHLHRWTDVANAHRFARDFGDVCRFDKDRSEWLVYDGRRWRVDTSEVEVQSLAIKSIKKLYGKLKSLEGDEVKTLNKHIKDSLKRSGVTGLVYLARTVPGMSVETTLWDADLFTLNVANGTLDLRTGVLRPHRSADMLTKMSPVSYDPSAVSPLWETFLQRVVPVDEMRGYLARVFGYSATGDTSEHCMHVFHGAGANGKSTIVDVVSHVLGDYYATAEASTFLVQRSDAPRNDLASLVGARMVAASETDAGRKFSEATVKNITGGDPVKCRFLHKNLFTYTPQYTLFLLTNSKPRVEGGDEGIWRRIRLVPFKVVIPEQERDKHLKEKIKVQASGVLTWIVRGCLEWQKTGLGTPVEVQEATKEYRDEMDPVAAWMDECCTVNKGDPELWCSNSDLYNSYRMYAIGANEEPISAEAFGVFLGSHGHESKTKTVKSKTLRGRTGIKLGAPKLEEKSDVKSAKIAPI